MTERWLPVPGMEGAYEVSDHGRVRSLIPWRGRAGRIMAPALTEEGYHRVRLGLGDERRGYLVHVLTAAAFLGPRPPGQQVRHLDGDPNNGYASNLAYGTPSDNTLDSVAHGTHPHARRVLCANGHPLTAAKGRRRCRTCAAAAQARYRARRAGQG